MTKPLRRRFLQTAAVSGLSGWMAAGFPRPAMASAPSPGEHVLNVRQYGAVGDGHTDDTLAFQKALDAAAPDGGLVSVPVGVYRIGTRLTIPPNVTLQGISRGPMSHAGVRDSGLSLPNRGTVLLAVADRGQETGPAFLSLNENSALLGLSIYYPHQDPQAVPVAYPWTIQMRGNNPTVQDVELLNSYQGIDCTQNQRHLVRNVTGQPLRQGIWVDAIYDIGHIENVHWNPWWSTHQSVFDFMFHHGEGFVFGRADWEYVLNTFCFGYRTGYRFVETGQGACNGNFLGIGADDCWTSCQVDQSAPYGLLITNGEFVAAKGELMVFPEADPSQVAVGPKHSGAVRFVNCAFWGPSRRIAQVAGTGTVGFSDCTFCAWDTDHQGETAIHAQSGTLLVQGCEFQQAKPQVQLDADVLRAVILGNVFTGPADIRNASHGDVQIGFNSAHG